MRQDGGGARGHQRAFGLSAPRSGGGGKFSAAWTIALGEGRSRVAEHAIARLLVGEHTPVFYRGRQVGKRVRFNDRLAIAVLNLHAAALRARGPSMNENASTDFWRDIA